MCTRQIALIQFSQSLMDIIPGIFHSLLTLYSSVLTERQLS